MGFSCPRQSVPARAQAALRPSPAALVDGPLATQLHHRSETAVSPIETRRVAANFGRAAARYEQHARLQAAVRDELLDRLDALRVAPTRVIDAGCGTGLGSRQLQRRFPKAQVLGLDLSRPMLQQARRQRAWLRPFQLLQGNVSALPLATDSVDLIFSSLCLQWCADLPALFAEWQRVLRPGGLLLFATFGLDTLSELRQAFAEVDDQPHLLVFAHIQQIGDAMHRAGLVNPVVDRDLHGRPVAQLRELFDELRGLGATNALSERRRGLTGRQRWRALTEAYEAFRRPDGLLPVSWEVVYGQAFGSEARPVNPAGFDLDALRATLPSRRTQG